MSKQYFHFTLGPVQGFVAQARRTRDFWAGSFILSWLAAIAMKATTTQGATIKFPAPDQNFMDWLEGKGAKDKPTQGSIPNRFKAEFDGSFNPDLVTETVQKAWKALADKVWEEDLAGVASKEAKEIWDRQIPAFWDMSWVIVDKEADSSALDRRKNWRTYAASNEGGVKCTMMEGWQELSGALSPNRKSLDTFWDEVIKNGKAGMKSDLAKNETLCSIAFVKRRFSRYFKDISCDMPNGWTAHGWDIPSAVPSVTYMAAVHWLKKLIGQADSKHYESQLLRFHEAASDLVGSEYGEWSTNIRCLEDLKNASAFKRLRSLDGNVFFESQLDNKNNFADQEKAQNCKRRLIDVCKTAELAAPTPFYAILMMDGDSLGIQMSNPDKQDSITKGLKEFTKGVKPIVEKHNGFLIYAGGDDVLAILPLEDAIPCATALREDYLDCFKGKNVNTTISGAIEFAHIKMPLTKVLKDAHQLLDDIAKDEAGRDALAIRVWKGGGLQLEWAQPWDIALLSNQQTYLEKLTEEFKAIHETDNQFSNKFFYKVREHFSLLNPLDKEQCYFVEKSKTDQQIQMASSLLAVDYINSGKTRISDLKNAKERIDKAQDAVRPLLNQCMPVKRIADKEQVHWQYSSCLKADAALLVRFLAQKGVETR
jgi:CRISPR-associated protein Cmr2